MPISQLYESLNWSKTVFVNTVYKLFKRMFSYTGVNAKLGFGKTSFMNTPDSVQYDSGLNMRNHSTNALL